MAKLLARIDEMKGLEDGWAGERSTAVDPAALHAVSELAPRLMGAVPGVAVVPSTDGTVVLEWEAGDVAYTVEIIRPDLIDVVEDHLETDELSEWQIHDMNALLGFLRSTGRV